MGCHKLLYYEGREEEFGHKHATHRARLHACASGALMGCHKLLYYLYYERKAEELGHKHATHRARLHACASGGVNVTPIFKDDRVSEDLQRAGDNQMKR